MTRRLAIFISFSGQGGVERMVASLAGGMAETGLAVDLVLAKARGEHVQAIPPSVRVVRLGSDHTATALPALARYLRRERPDALLAAKDRAIRTAVLARRLAGVGVPIAGRLGTTVSAALEGKHPLRRALWYANMRLFYRGVERIVAVSQGVADDVRRITGLPAERVVVVRNPVVTPQLAERAAQPVTHPWLAQRTVPVVVGAGRLSRQKDFPTLLHAFALLRRDLPCRLLILGDGGERAALLELADRLGIGADVELPGFQANPYPWFARADLFVLSSRWEGSPNVLTEALALGTPVVATDCPSGPAEILQGGHFGPLVPMGDAAALAAAMRATLANPLPAAALRAAVADYRLDHSVRGYLAALGLTP